MPVFLWFLWRGIVSRQYDRIFNACRSSHSALAPEAFHYLLPFERAYGDRRKRGKPSIDVPRSANSR